MGNNQANSGQKSQDLGGEAALDGENIIPMADYSPYIGEELLRIARSYVGKLGVNGKLRDDAVQEFCLGALEAATRQEKGKGIRAYQFMTGRGKALNFLRRCRQHAHLHPLSYDAGEGFVDGDEISESGDQLENVQKQDPAASEREEAYGFLHSVIETLPAIEQQVIRCRYFDNLTQEGAARKLGIPRGKVRGAEKRARMWLRKRLGEANNVSWKSITF